MSKIPISKIIRSKRKNIALVISHDATLVVRAPMRTSLSYIEKLVEEKFAWIERKMREFEKRPKADKKTFSEGEEFLYLGKKYKLELTDGLEIETTEDFELLFPKVFLWRAKARMHDWYKKQALKEITERTKVISEKLNLRYCSLKISNAKTNWGSCGPKNSLNFNWRLIMAPESVMDYVIIHELMHIIEKNHSARFWNKVAVVMPEYKSARKWLRENSKVLTLE
ncbi:MAG: SprT family zinc-dependent metalloprotease [Candidatus Moranbacteria bacterium]|nr:SprT family zinc-dependent metalloprotease [Candidatus Moranbacteria bacterium]